MKRLAILLTLLATFAASATALADPPWARGDRDGYRDGYIAYARVTDVRPIYRRVYDRRRECRTVQVGVQDAGAGNRAAGTALGAVVGGVLGNTIGKGDGRTAATVAGAVAGAVVGNKIASDGRGAEDERPVYQQRCRMDAEPVGREIVAYVVHYRYHGEFFRARMDHAPGRHLRVYVHDGDVRPAE